MLGPNLFVGVGGLFRTGSKDDSFQQKPASGGGKIEYALVSEKFTEVSPNVRYGGGIRRAQVDKEDRAFGHAESLVGGSAPMSNEV